MGLDGTKVVAKIKNGMGGGDAGGVAKVEMGSYEAIDIA